MEIGPALGHLEPQGYAMTDQVIIWQRLADPSMYHPEGIIRVPLWI